MGETAQDDAQLASCRHDLDAAFSAVWKQLENAVGNRRSMLHTPAFANIGEAGAPEIRTMVLRAASRADASLRFHSDRRCSKLDQLMRNPQCSILGYDPKTKTQLRLKGSASVHFDDEICDAAWAGAQAMSRLCYVQDLAPGSEIADPDVVQAATMEDADGGRENFCAIIVRVSAIDWLWLHHKGHRRARWTREGSAWTGCWLAP